MPQHPEPLHRSNQAARTSTSNEPRPTPLSAVVSDAVQRWFEEAQQDAQRGDAKQQALLSQMLSEGYGCQQDKKAAEMWAQLARARGYQMKGVYCEL